MPKRIKYDYDYLQSLTESEVRRVVKREAERINRQISRYKKAGKYAPDVIGSKQLERVNIRQIGKRNKRQLIYQYQELQKRSISGEGITRAGIKAARKARAEFAAELNVSEDIITAEDLPVLHAAAEQAKTENAAFYEVLSRAVLQGVEENTQFFRTTSSALTEQSKTVAGRRQIMDDLIRRINEAVVAENKQARLEGKRLYDSLHKRFSFEQASKKAQSKARKARKAKYKQRK